ncbi:precorrin-6A synthase (deacetylating) [Streptomyces sp. NPDC051577]|uniref:precorrin-6A synthase (deacetylating) n=1 Tax=Streptomyces sp. NPDC051577 TaxID=3155166 RepID=UPI003425A11F
MKKFYVIGIGAGDPDHLTLQAVKAIGASDAFLILEKGEEKSDLTGLRRAMLEEYARPGHRLVEGRDPDRDRTPAHYAPTVDGWRSARAEIFERFIAEDLADGETGTFLVWGDPSLYDSTLAILDEVLEKGRVAFDHEVVPGISSISSLLARHRTTLNRVGRPVQITTGRRLAEGWPQDVDDVVVMLDARHAFTAHLDQDLYIHWGAYVGTPDEILVSGKLAEVAGRIEELRTEARHRKGWIMDTYLLRRP